MQLSNLMNIDELIQRIYVERIEEDSEIFFEAYCPYCHETEECMVDHGKDAEARSCAIGKMMDQWRLTKLRLMIIERTLKDARHHHLCADLNSSPAARNSQPIYLPGRQGPATEPFLGPKIASPKFLQGKHDRECQIDQFDCQGKVKGAIWPGVRTVILLQAGGGDIKLDSLPLLGDFEFGQRK